MSVAKNFTQIANAASQQINPVNIINWSLIPAGITLFITILLIVFVWGPKFNGSYEYQQCKGNGRNKKCVVKTGSLAKRNVMLILLLVLLIPSIIAGIGYKIGFTIANPKISAGIYATSAFSDAAFD
tara:strand:- start:19478 stop:19858 length:381 start_codon:yes stop_codon:yes gene_type:complete